MHRTGPKTQDAGRQILNKMQAFKKLKLKNKTCKIPNPKVEKQIKSRAQTRNDVSGEKEGRENHTKTGNEKKSVSREGRTSK